MYLDEKEPTIIRSAYRHGVGSDDIAAGTEIGRAHV